MRIDSMYFRLWFKGSTLEKNSFVIIELIHLLLKRRFILWVAPIEKLFHVLSNAISLDNQTFLSLGMWILSLTFFSSKSFICFFISLSFPKQYGRKGVGGGERWRFRGVGPGGDSLLGGATCKRSVDPNCTIHWIMFCLDGYSIIHPLNNWCLQ